MGKGEKACSGDRRRKTNRLLHDRSDRCVHVVDHDATPNPLRRSALLSPVPSLGHQIKSGKVHIIIIMKLAKEGTKPARNQADDAVLYAYVYGIGASA